MRLGPQQQPKRPDLVQTFPHQPVSGDGEVRRGDVERLAGGLRQQLVEGIRHTVPLVVDDEGQWHGMRCLSVKQWHT